MTIASCSNDNKGSKYVSEQIESKLQHADSLFESNESIAIELYIELLNDKGNSDTEIKCNALEGILKYHMFKANDTLSFNYFLAEHKLRCTSETERIHNKYFELRSEHDQKLISKNLFIVNDKKWKELILECDLYKLYELKTLILATKAIYHELQERNDKKAIKSYLQAISSSSHTSFEFHELRKFVSYLNIGNIYQKQGETTRALSYYKLGLNSKSNRKHSQSVITAYKWISQCFANLNQIDSSLYYLDQSYKLSEKYNSRRQATQVKEIQEKYQNEKLSNSLAQSSIKRKQFYIASLSLGGLLSISLIGLWGLRRFNNLKQLTLNQEIKDTQQQGQLAAINAQLDGEEQERKRVASVLHDGISSHLTAASFHLQLLTQNEITNQQAVSKAADLIEEAAERSRELSHQLYPPVLIKHGLVAALEALSSSFTNASLTYKVVNILTIKSINTNLESKLYYIISEVMQNVLKHSQATHCELHISNIEDMLKVNIKDNGIGIHKNTNSTGLGLSSIHARIQSLNGTVQISTNDGIGTTVVMEVPLM